MDEKLKSDIVADVDAYMHPSAREFYASRGIPFRRGYLFYGPPGTGKTSFSLALAGHCKLDLYMLSLANGSIEEDDLTRMFASLPPRCVVLLEDIDSAGIKRETEDDEPDKYHRRGRVSLSGLLNAIDGTSSQEGRLLIMTSNNPDALDKALVRPGRIDRKVYFGPINRASAEQIFIRMFTSQRLESEKAVSVSENGHVSSSEKVEVEKELEQGDFIDLSKRFAESIPEDKFTPAELQGFLLANRLSPTGAVENIGAWVETELAVQEEEREKEEKKKKKAAAKKKTKKALAALEKLGVASDGDSDADGESVKSEDLDEELEEMQNEELLKKMAKSGMSKDKLAEMTKVLKMGGKHGSPDVNGVAVETEAKNSELTNGAVEEVGKISESTNGEDTKTGAEDSSDIPHTNGFANAKPKEEKHIIGDKGFAKTIADLEEEEKGKNASRRLTKATKKKLEAEEKAGEKARKTQ